MLTGATPDRCKGVRLPWRALLLAAVALVVAMALRLLVIEQPHWAWPCQSEVSPWWCPLRSGGIFALRAGAVGFAALAAGVVAIWRGDGNAAVLALAAGAAGLVLYVPEPAAGGLLLGAIALLRR